MQDLPVICILIFSINQCNSHYTNKDQRDLVSDSKTCLCSIHTELVTSCAAQNIVVLQDKFLRLMYSDQKAETCLFKDAYNFTYL